MSGNIILIIAGVAIFVAGLAKGRGGFKLSNFGINFGSTNAQSINFRTGTPELAPRKKPDWVGLAVKALGFLTAVTGLVRELNG